MKLQIKTLDKINITYFIFVYVKNDRYTDSATANHANCRSAMNTIIHDHC